MGVDKKPFKVVIVGAGFGGLSLANMLEKFDIDYVLLEAHFQIAPAIGAGIVMAPNGLRILDQIGCYKPIKELGGCNTNRFYIRDTDGSPLLTCRNANEHYVKRTGYPILFLHRTPLLQALYENIQHKEKILLNKRVCNIDLGDDGVRVHTHDGDNFEGSLVIGTDGIHSAVRENMFRIAKKLQPGYFPEDPSSKVPSYYRAIYGVAKDVPGFRDTDVNTCIGYNSSHFSLPGIDGQVFYFVSEKWPKTQYGEDIQRCFTKEEEAEFVKKYAGLKFNETTTFEDIYAHKVVGGMTSLHHTVYEKWSFRRILVIGDSAHKLNPCTGQGANQAIESAAELVNAIVKIRNKRPLDRLTNSDIEKITQHVESKRMARAKKLVAISHENQTLIANENPLLSWFALGVMLLFTKEEFAVDMHSVPMSGAARLVDVPMPYLSHVTPFDDELPVKPVGGLASWLGWAAFSGGMGVLMYLTNKTSRLGISNARLWAGTTPIIGPWSGETGFSGILTKLVSTFSDNLTSPDVATKVQIAHFMTQIISPILIYTVEGYRAGSQSNIISFPIAFLSLMQLYGIGRIAPIYALFHSCLQETAVHYRYVRPEIAKSLVPALTLGYVIPTALMLIPSANASTWQDWTFVWQLAPPLVPFLVKAFSTGMRWWKKAGKTLIAEEKEQEDVKQRFAHYGDDDVNDLKSAYSYASILQASAHIATLAYSCSRPGLSFRKIFCSLPTPFAKNWNSPNHAAEVATLFRYDMALAVGTFAAHNLYSIWQLRRDGYIRTRDAAKAAIAVVFGQLVVGPGATWTGLWHWREGVVAGLIRK